MSDTELLDLQQTLYDSSNPTRRWLHRSRRDWVMAQIAKAPVAGGKALEIGPGSGVYLPALAERFQSVTATDIEDEFLVNARKLAEKLPGLTARRDDASNSSLPDKEFDLVLCTEVVEHIERSDLVIKNIHRILSDDGTLILTTPQRYSFLEMTAKIAFLPGIRRIVQAVYAEPVLELGHINLMTRATVRKQLADAGFQVEEHYLCGFYFPLIAEFGGEAGQRLLRATGDALRGGFLDWTLWTQCYIVRKARGPR